MSSSAGPWQPRKTRRGTDPRRRLTVRGHVVALGAALLLIPPPMAQGQGRLGSGAVTEELRRRVEQIREEGGLDVRGRTLVVAERVAEVYEHRVFRPLWSDASGTELVRAVLGLEADGLSPARYHLDALEGLLPLASLDAPGRAEAELLRTDAFLAAALDLGRGRVEPTELDPLWRVARPAPPGLAPDSVATAIDAGRVGAWLDGMRPVHPIYRRMMQALAAHRHQREQGGWNPLPEDAFLGLDSTGAAVPVLRRRLVRSGDLPADADTLSRRFDGALAEAVRRFQHRHGLNEDGVVGPATRAALDVPVEERIDQLRVNLERARWVLRTLADTFVAVNIAGQRVYVVRGDSVLLEMRAVVGRDYTRTPVFSAPMRYLVLNPTWTVPRSINGEILAHVRRDPSYLEREGFVVLDAQGRSVDPASVDFRGYTGANFPWIFRQMPGPRNALGRIKFMLPNEFDVYLHDTPSRSLFLREERLFSHGCIRVEEPLALADLLLEAVDREDLEGLLASGRTLTLDLPRPVPVLILYWTAATDLHGELHFYRDIYGRDPALLRALDRPSEH